MLLLRKCKKVAVAPNIYIANLGGVSAKSNGDFKRASGRGQKNSVGLDLDHSAANFNSDDYHNFL